MKYFVLVIALFAITFAQDAKKCQLKVMDSSYMERAYYGSLFNGTQSNMYYSFVGESQDVILYLTDNPSGSVSYSNTTLVIRNGLTGASVLAGSFITFLQNGTEYRLQIINGIKGNCSSVMSGPVPQLSKIFSNLFQIFPFPGMKPKPGDYTLCQGLAGNPPTDIMNVVYNGSEMYGGLTTVSVLSENQSSYAGIKKFRPLTDKDRHFFTNPCPKGAENKDTDQLIELMHEALRHH